jgi:eukaryotic-like serine/threonine-protein kinase
MLVPGAEIGGFRLEEPVHAGGMATLWRVTRDHDDPPLIMKIPRLSHGEDPATIVAFEVERMILPHLAGPHVPRFVATGDFDQPYVVLEYVAGTPLRAQLDATPLPAAEVARAGAAIATALDDVHGQRVIHHDVKPSNVIVRPDGACVLIDFGFARHALLPDLIAQEFHGPVGTGPYVSPEQLRGERDDPRSDLFALGVILYFLATGERPFGDPDTVGEWRRRLWRDPVPPRRRNPDCPPWLQEVVLRCLEVDPSARYATAADVRRALADPERVPLTERAHRLRRDGMLRVFRRRWQAEHAPARRSPAATPPATPAVMAALDLNPGMEPLVDAVRREVLRLIAAAPATRVACVNVMKLSRIAQDEFEDAEGRNLHLRRLAELQRWARALPLPPDRLTYHVLESPDPGGALLEFAEANRIGHIVMGARGASTARRYLGSVSSKVVAEATCTVTVVRVPAPSA